MRFISKIRKYQIGFKADVTNHFATGESQVIQPLWNCEFDPFRSLNPWEVEAANARFVNTGLMLELDGHTTIDAMDRYSVFDTHDAQKHWGLTDAQRVELEEHLQNNLSHGVYYIRVDAPVLAPPWPTYDSFRGVKGTPTAQRIAEKVLEDGYDVGVVLAYERQGANRTEVLDALEALQAPVVEAENETLVSA